MPASNNGIDLIKANFISTRVVHTDTLSEWLTGFAKPNLPPSADPENGCSAIVFALCAIWIA